MRRLPLLLLALGLLHCQPGAPARLRLRQDRFWPAGSQGEQGQTWAVPVCVRAGTGSQAERGCTLLTGAEGELELKAPGCPRWVLLNADGRGYYLLTQARGAKDRRERSVLLSVSRAWACSATPPSVREFLRAQGQAAPVAPR